MRLRILSSDYDFQDSDVKLLAYLNWCGYQDLNLGPRHYQCRALTN